MAAMKNNKDVKRGIKVYLDGKEVSANATVIRAEMRKLKGEIDKMTIGSEEYYRATKKYKDLDSILLQHRKQLKGVEDQQQSLLSRGYNFMQKYYAGLTALIAGLTGVAFQINRFRKMAAEQEDAAANLKALTGLDDDSISWLTKQAETLSTTMEKSGLRVRKSTKEILEAYMLVGSAKPELLKDREALNAVTIEAMRLSEAAKMELNEAVNALTTSLNQYSAGADQAARFTNVLAAGSKFGAANVQDQAAAVVKAGVAASSAGVSFEQLVGVIEMLGEKGIKAEEAGTSLKRFFLKLQTDADDTNPAIVGLDKALENLAAKHLSMGDLQKMFGDRAINVAKILIDNTEKVKNYTEAVTDTNVAVEQAKINSETTAARMAQVRNQLNLTGQELAKTLAPVLSKTVGWTRKFVMMLPGLIDWIKKWGLEILVLAAAYTTYAYGARMADAVTKAWHATVLFFTTGIAKMRAAVQLTTLAINFNRKAMVQMGLQMRSMNTLSKLFVASQALVRAALLAVTGQTTKAARAMAVFQLVMKSVNPWTAAAAAIAAVGTALYVYYKRGKEAVHVNKELKQAQEDAATRYDEQSTHIERLNKTVHDETLGYRQRNSALEELKRLVPGYEASLTKEGKLINDNTTAIDNYLERLKKEIALKALEEQLVESLKNKRKARDKRDDNEAEAARHYNARMDEQEGKNGTMGRFNPIRWVWHAAAEQYYDFKAGNAKEELKQAEKDTEELQAEIDNVTKQLDELFNKAAGGGGTENPDPIGEPEKESEKQKRIRKAIEAVNLEYDAKANDLKQKYINGEIATEEQYSKQLQDLELERLNKQLAIAGLEPEKREQIRGKILELTIKLREQLKQQDEKLKKDTEKAASERLNISRQAMQDALTQMRRTRIKEGLTEDEYAQRVLEIRRAFYRQALQDKTLSDQERQKLQREANELEITEEERKQKKLEELAQKQEDRQRQLFDALRSAGEEMGEALGEWLTDTENTFEDFSKQLLKTIVKTVENIITAAIVQRTVENIRMLGFWGIAKAAGEIALIKAAGAALDGLVENFYTGGYTGRGPWDEPRGVVHAGEFVANRYAVANSAVRPVLDIIDQAQRRGTIANLTAEDIIAAATPSRPSAAPTHSPATVPVASASGAPVRDPELTAAIRLLTRTTARAAEAYREPAQAYTFVDGRGGVNEAQALLARMKTNASRRNS